MLDLTPHRADARLLVYFAEPESLHVVRNVPWPRTESTLTHAGPGWSMLTYAGPCLPMLARTNLYHPWVGTVTVALLCFDWGPTLSMRRL